MLVAVAVLCLIPGPLQRTRPCAVATAVTPAADAEGTQIVRQLPSAIVPNLGQWAHSARYVTKIDGVTVFFDRKGWTFALREKADREGCEGRTAKWRPSVDDRASLLGVAVRMTFSGGRDTEIAAEEQLPGRHNYFLGDDPSKWRSDVPLYRC